MEGPVEKQKGVVSYRQSVCCYHSKQKIVKIMQGHESGKKTGLNILFAESKGQEPWAHLP
jgi:hypothetical protein